MRETRDTFAIVKFSFQAVITLLVIIFSMWMLMNQSGEPGIYLPIISGLVCAWLPQPSLKRKAADSGGGGGGGGPLIQSSSEKTIPSFPEDDIV